MTDFGEKLRRERESRDVSLRELSDATKIGKRYLEALERNEFDALPGGVFAKGYIRSYAEYLGLDPEPLLEDYLRERRARGEGDPGDDEQAAQEAAQAVLSHLAASQGVPTSRGFRTGWIVGAGLLVVVVAAVLAWVWLVPRGPLPEEAAARPDAPAAAPTGAVESGAAEEPRTEPVAQTEAVPRTASAEAEPEPPATASMAEPEPSPPAPTPTTQPAGEVPSAVAARPGPASPPDEPAEESHLSVPDYGVGTDVVNRQLAGRGDRFPEGAAVWFWTRVLGGRPGDEIRHVWIREGRPQGTIELRVGASHWRTQSRWTMRQGSAGAWAVEARDAAGRLLGRAEFTCVPAD